jgi:hypothetical protein
MYKWLQLILTTMFSIMVSSVVYADKTPSVSLNRSSFFSTVEADREYIDSNYMFFDDHCTSSLEIPLWDNPELTGQPKAYRMTRYNIHSPSAEYDMKSENDFKYHFDYLRKYDYLPSEFRKQWYTHGFLNRLPVFDDQMNARKRKTESWPIRALVIVRTSKYDSGININTFAFDKQGNVVDGAQPKVKKRVSIACNALFLLKNNILESSMITQAIGLSFYAYEQRVCHFFPSNLNDTEGMTIGNLTVHRKRLLSYCKSESFLPLNADGSNQAEFENGMETDLGPHLQSFIPSELDLSKPIESNNFILTVRFSDPVKPVYHASLPNQCLVDCPNTGAKQIEGLELKLKTIEEKQGKKK